MDYKALDQKAKNVAAQYKHCEQKLVQIISQVDRYKAFYKLGYSSLFSYMTKALGLSEAMACNISAVVRKSYEVPELQQKVVAGAISLSKARKLTPVINSGNHEVWLKVAQNKSQKQIEREVSLAKPKVAITERTTYSPPAEPIKEKLIIKQSGARLKMELGLSEKLMLSFKRCQDLESQRQKKHIDYEECLEALVDLYLEKKDPFRKAQRQKVRGKLDAKASVSDIDKNKKRLQEIVSRPLIKNKKTTKHTGRKREPLPAKIRHQVFLRDQGRCAHRDSSGTRCCSQRYLEIHHIKPVSQGGQNNLENLKLLCHGHHKMEHLKME